MVKSKSIIDENSRNVEEMDIPLEKIEEMLNESRQAKRLLNDSTVSKFLTRT